VSPAVNPLVLELRLSPGLAYVTAPVGAGHDALLDGDAVVVVVLVPVLGVVVVALVADVLVLGVVVVALVADVLVLGVVVVALVVEGVVVAGTTAAWIWAVGSEIAYVVPFLFVAITATRSVEPRSAEGGEYVLAAAPVMPPQFAPCESHRCHW
jgi:hypothetical protein